MTDLTGTRTNYYQGEIVDAVAYIHPLSAWDDEVPELLTRFKALFVDDEERFRQLCTKLLEDEKYEVVFGAVKLIGSWGVRDDKQAALLLYVAFKQENVREAALWAFWRIGSCKFLPQILVFAERGSAAALYRLRQMRLSPEEIEVLEKNIQ